MAAEQENQENVQLKAEDNENIHHENDELGTIAESEKQEQAKMIDFKRNNEWADRSSFAHGLSVGLGIGCLAAFIILWIAVFFTPQLPSSVTYESMLSVFIYPMVYLLAVGLIALTAGIVREYYTLKIKCRHQSSPKHF